MLRMSSPRRKQFIVATLVALGAVLLTGTAYTRDTTQSLAFQCADNTRFTLEFHSGHVRLRHGAGVFSLSLEQGADGTRYSDGDHYLWTEGSRARLEGGGFPQGSECVAEDGRA